MGKTKRLMECSRAPLELAVYDDVMPYRDPNNALSARRDEIQRELEDIKARIGDFDYLKWRQKELEAELVALGKSTTHLPGSRARIEKWLVSGLVVIVLGTAILAVVALRLRRSSSEAAPVRLPRTDATAVVSVVLPSSGGGMVPITGPHPDLDLPPSPPATPHLTRTMPPQTSGF
jgi:hypothetical protein